MHNVVNVVNVVNRIKRERKSCSTFQRIYFLVAQVLYNFVKNNLHATETTNMCRLYNLHKVHQAEIIRQAYLYLCCHKQDSINYAHVHPQY